MIRRVYCRIPHRRGALTSLTAMERRFRGHGLSKWNFYAPLSTSDFDMNERKQRLTKRLDSEMVMSSESSSPKDGYEELVTMIQDENLRAARVKVPWFLDQMPPVYFSQVEASLRDQHLSALVALYDTDAVPELTLNSCDGRYMTKITPGLFSPTLLSEQLKALPTNAPLCGLQVYTSKDNEATFSIFTFDNNDEVGSAEGEDFSLPQELETYCNDLKAGKYKNDPRHAKHSKHLERKSLMSFIKERFPGEFRMNSSPRRFCKQVDLYHRTMSSGGDDVGVDIEPNWNGDSKKTMVTLAISNVIVMPAIRRITEYFATKNIGIVRTHLDLFKGTEKGGKLSNTNKVAMFRILVQSSIPGDLNMDDENRVMEEDLGTVSKWIDDRSLSILRQFDLSANEADLVIGLCDLVHAILAPKDPYEYSRINVQAVLCDTGRFESFTRDIIELFHKRFNPNTEHPERNDELFTAELEKLHERVRNSGELAVAQKVLLTVLDVMKGIYRTNLYRRGRFALSFRLNPEVCVQNILDGAYRTEAPYGLFFVHGRRFSGFHVRFRDISRGGLRLVTPRNLEMHGVESARQLVECYDLASAQQLKNKDIAEGGSKAVCLVDTIGFSGIEREHVMRKSLKAMVDSVLDLIAPNSHDKSNIVDHMKGKDEFIYFGPDEQVTPEHIEWMVERAAERQYPMPSAFMSSKPDAGINHKEFGVTSEGVAVFLDEALKATGVDTNKPFTIKMTGGPDGDVAGNMLKILHREYGDNAKIVGLADGTGGIVDPDGLDWSELLRLFKSSLPLNKFDPKKFGKSTDLFLADTPEGINRRNMMHNEVEADAFVPAGGRPETINDQNWHLFLNSETKKPSSPLIVEGANLFLTPEARANLSKAGCVIVKDSSANKCGVICSSFEIISSMLLSKSEFLELKPKFVPDVLSELRRKALFEAKLMFRELVANPDQSLVPISRKISYAINRSTDCFAALLSELPDEQYQKLLPVIKDNLPKALMDVAWDRFVDAVPPAYVRYQLACILASHLVYNEGVEYATSINESVLGEWLLSYLEKSIESEGMAKKVADGTALTETEKNAIVGILRKGGARAMVDHNI